MQKRALGGLPVSLAGLGCNNFGGRCDQERTSQVVHSALDSGITFFDTADVYGGGFSEEFLGVALEKHRDEVVIATKFGYQFGDLPEQSGGSARWVRAAVEGSLRRLGTDRIDLYQMHLPDPKTPIAETLDALNSLVVEGKVREIGCSNFSGEQMDESTAISAERGLARFVSAQNFYNVLSREAENDVLPGCDRNGLGQLPYFPLANGMLTGKYRQGAPLPEGSRLAGVPAERAERVLSDRNFAIVEALEAFALARGHTLLECAMSWLAARPVVASVIAGATRPEQVAENARAVDWALTDAERAEIDQIAAPA